MPLGDATPLNQVLLQAPGVVQDSYGQLHVRGDHADLDLAGPRFRLRHLANLQLIDPTKTDQNHSLHRCGPFRFMSRRE